MKTIDIFPWNKHFETGIEMIDMQHAQLVKLLNRLASQVANQASVEELGLIFDELVEYTVYHFKSEELIWDKYFQNDPLNTQHQETHENFIDIVSNFRKLLDTKPLVELATEALEYLAKWLVSHILETDRYMAFIVLDLENGLELSVAKEKAEDKIHGSGRVLVEIILSIYNTLSSNLLQLMKELRLHQSFEQKISYQDRYLQLLLKLASSFINIPLDEIDSQINKALKEMALFAGVDRAYIFDYDFVANIMVNSYEWCSDEILPQMERLQYIPIGLAIDWLKIHEKGKHVLIEDVKALPDGDLRDILLPQNIQSLVTFPLFENDICCGFVGFDAVKELHLFTDVEIELLSYFSKLLGNIADRKKVEKNLILERNHFERYLHTVQSIIVSMDTNGFITLVNRKGCDLLGYSQEELIGKQWFEFCLSQPEGMEQVYPVFLEIMHENLEGSEYFENEVLTKSGEKKLIAWHNSYLEGEDGTIIGTLSAGEDITKSRESEKKLRLAASVFTHSQEGILITSAENKIIELNHAVEKITGYSREELIGKNPKVLSSGQHTLSFYKHMWKELHANGSWSGELVNRNKFGHIYTEMLTISTVKDEDGVVIHYVGHFTDISTVKEQQKHLEFIAHYDALTGLPNRVLLSDRIKQEMAYTRRNKSTIAIVYLDLDGFKEINDSYGHDVGDKLLSIIADKMKKMLREGDTIARLGGDEFVAVLHNLRTHEESIPMLKRLLSAASEPIEIENIAMQVSASLGVSFFNSEDTFDADQLLRFADQAMYQAKLAGKNRYHIFDVVEDANVRTQHEYVEMVQKALEDDEFILYYQPKVNMRTGKIVGIEALIRWNNKTRGILSPGTFLPIIEGHSLNIEIGELVLEKAFEQISLWKEKGVELVVSVNIDALHLLDGNLVEYLKHLLRSYPAVKAEDISLEILETSALKDMLQVSKIMQECKDLGIAFSLDDFGTGYSSLTYLKRLPASELKIDQSFVRDMLYDPDDLAILEGVIGLASAFRRHIIAEGVESIKQGYVLLQLGCEVAQGYVIAHPMPAQKIKGWIENWKPDPSWSNVTPITREDIPLLYATVEHIAWVENILSFLKNNFFAPLQQNHTECRFGQWLHKSGKENYGSKADFEAIEELHFKIHLYANRLIDMKKSDSEITQSDIKGLRKLSKELVSTLEGWQIQ